MARRLILASSSASRLSILRTAGFAPEVIVSGVDEKLPIDRTERLVQTLAERKALAVAHDLTDAIVIGCDSLLDLDGVAYGKPESIEVARGSWRQMSGSDATLMTGHCLVDRPTGRLVSTVVKTKVTFGHPSDEELERYLATGESLSTAGGFTLEGFGSPFVERVDGDALNVMGISPTVVRRLLRELDVPLTSVWLVEACR